MSYYPHVRRHTPASHRRQAAPPISLLARPRLPVSAAPPTGRLALARLPTTRSALPASCRRRSLVASPGRAPPQPPIAKLIAEQVDAVLPVTGLAPT
jgi:hypothetical protein